MEKLLLRNAGELLARATGLWPPNNVTVEWVDDLPVGVTGRLVPKRRLIKLNRHSRYTCAYPVRVLVHELAHFTHWDATGFAGVCRLEIEQFAVAAALLVQVMLAGKILSRYADDDLVYKSAERWFERHTPEQVKAWMQYVLCF